MADLNAISIVGRLGKDPELKATDSGNMVARITVAVKNAKADDSATWFNCQLWGKKAEVVSEHLRKGQRIGLIGRIESEDWTDKDGNKRTSMLLKASDFFFVESAPER
jgi:single-strand DNA-binding protein